MARWDPIIIFCALLCLHGKAAASTLLSIPHEDPDVNKNVSELITSKGYPVEEHTVRTADGYLLSVQRIPYGRGRNSGTSQRGVALLIHGLFCDASVWVWNFPNQSLGFVLPDAGYDTWLLNTRGCTYSRKHEEYTTNQYQFWNFSFAEMGKFDIPATINHILETTGEEGLYVIGHAQGNTAAFVTLSELPEYNDKIKLFIALSPLTTLAYSTSIVRVLMAVPDEVFFAVDIITSGELIPNSKIFKYLRVKSCESFAAEFCADALFLVGGEDREQLNKTRLGVYYANIPASTSTKSFLHYKQTAESKKFREYDYGRYNMKYYNQEVPPEYDISSITAPVALFWSTNDLIADPEDVAILRGKLNSIVEDYPIPYPYSDFDFILALNAFELIHKPILQLLPQY